LKVKRKNEDLSEACFIRRSGSDKSILITGIPGCDKDVILSALSGLNIDSGGWNGNGSCSSQIHIKYKGKQIDLLSLPETYSLWLSGNGAGFTGNCFAFADYDAFIIVCKSGSIAYGESLYAEATKFCPEGYLCINSLSGNFRFQFKRFLSAPFQSKYGKAGAKGSNQSLAGSADSCIFNAGSKCKYKDIKPLDYEEIPLLSCFEFRSKTEILHKAKRIEVSGIKDIKRLKKVLFDTENLDGAGKKTAAVSDEVLSAVNLPQLFEPLIAMLTGLNPNADPYLEAIKFVLLAQEGVKLPFACFLPVQLNLTKEFIMCVNKICHQLNEHNIRLKDCSLAVKDKLKEDM
jgi:hypothetical protein